MRKYIIILLLSLSITLTGCKDTINETVDCDVTPTHVDCVTPLNKDYIDIYYMNDLHGAIIDADDKIGLSGIANYLKSLNEYPNNTIIIAGGDMLQGSALSNYYNGLSTIDLMDEIGFDSFTLGNHEFDWGLETVTQYFDEDETNGEADFPLLGANVFFEGTTTRPDYIDPYMIIEKAGLKIGIIGTMGAGLEYSIATSRISGYEFADPAAIVEEYAIELRTNQDCDIVIWVGHDSGNSNTIIGSLSGDAKIDAMFNAHSHSQYTRTIDDTPVIQSGSSGEYLGHLRLNLQDGEISSYVMENLELYDSALFSEEDDDTQLLIDQYLLETDSLFNSPIIDTDYAISQSALSLWIAELMRVSTGSDIGFQNGGGTTDSLNADETVTLGRLYELWPFDNVVKTVYLDGSTVNYLLGKDLISSTNISNFEAGTLYKVATNDYEFDKTSNPFIDGTDIDNTGLLMRDLAEDELLLQSSIYSTFKTSNTILTEDKTN